jgi:hypothetical protein
MIEAGPTDQQRADAHRAGLEVKLKELCLLIDAVKRDGMLANFTVTDDSFGRSVPTIRIIKLMA